MHKLTAIMRSIGSPVYLPILSNRQELGNYWGCVAAVVKARNYLTR